MVAAILWRKKLVLHRSLVEIFIGVSENPIMHAAPTPMSREISSAARGGDHSPEGAKLTPPLSLSFSLSLSSLMELAATARWRALPSTKSGKREGGDSPATRGGAAVPTGHRSLSLSPSQQPTGGGGDGGPVARPPLRQIWWKGRRRQPSDPAVAPSLSQIWRKATAGRRRHILGPSGDGGNGGEGPRPR